MRNMDIKLRPIESEEFDSLFSVVKQGIYSHVDAVFGWDDDFQRKRLKRDYDPSWFTGYNKEVSELACCVSNLMTM